MEIVSTITLDLGAKNNNQDNIKSTSSAAETMESNMSSEVAVAENTLKTSSFVEHLEAVTESVQAADELRCPAEEMRSPESQKRTTESSSVYHTPEVFSSPLPVRDLDLAKVRTALTELNTAVKEEEEHFFHQLDTARTQSSQLRQNAAGAQELKETNLKLKKSVEAAQIMMGKMRTESQVKLATLSDNLVTKDVEIAKLQAEYKVMNESKNTEMALMKKLLENQEEEASKLRTEYKIISDAKESEMSLLRKLMETQELEAKKSEAENSVINSSKDAELSRLKKLLAVQEEDAKEFAQRSQVWIAQEDELAGLRTEFESLQAAFEAVKQEKEEIEQGHEDAKEKWKKLVLTMKSEYDNFRASFEHLKASKRIMEETHAAEKTSLEKEAFKLRAENGSLSAAMDSLKICKEVSDSEYRDARQSWEKSKDEMESELTRLRVECGSLSKYNEEIDTKWANLNSQFDEKVRARVEPTEQKFSAIMDEFGNLKSEMYSLQLAKQDVEIENGDLKTQNEELTTELEGIKEEVAELQGNTEKLIQLKAEHTDLIKEHVWAEERIATMESNNESLSETHAAVLAELEEAKAKVVTHGELTEKFQTLETTLEAFKLTSKEDKQVSEKKIAKMSKSVETKKEAISLALAKYLKELKAKEKAEKEIVTLRIIVEENEDVINKHVADLEGAEKRVAALEDVVKFKDADHKAALTNLTEKVNDSLSYEASKREAALQAQVEAENKLAEMEKFVAKTESECLSAKCQSDGLREELEKTEAGRQVAVASTEALSKDLQETKEALEVAQAECESLRGMAQAEGESLRGMEQQVDSMSKSLAKKIATIAALESRCETLENTIDVSASTGIDSEAKMDFLHQMITSKEKELDLIKQRCAGLQVDLDQTEAKLGEKGEMEQRVKVAECKMTESVMLIEKKNKELQAMQDRCDKLQTSLKKAETLYLDGVENIKAEAERKQREALEEATDRAYVLNGLLKKKEEELVVLKESYDKLPAGTGEDGAELVAGCAAKAEAEKRAEEFKSLTNKISFLDELVCSKDSELQLIKDRCAGMQEAIMKMRDAHEKQISLIKEESEKMISQDQTEKEMQLRALSLGIAQKQAKLKSLNHGDQEEFEIVMANSEDEHLKQEVDALTARCGFLEQQLEKAEGKSTSLEACMSAGAEGGEQWKLRVDELEASLEKMTKQCEEESERRKEAERVFATINQKTSNEEKPSRSFFGRSKPTTDEAAKKPTRWQSLRARKKRDELSVATEGRASSTSKWQSPRSPRRAIGTTPRARSVAEDIPPTPKVYYGSEKERILAQIPAHIKNNFHEVGIYKQRLHNSYLPVLCLSPYDVPPGPIRDEWLSKFDGQSKVLSLGVYFLGKDGKEEGSYGTIPWFSFVPYSKAVPRGLDQIPQAITDKFEAGGILTREEKQVWDGMKELTNVAAMNKEERTHPLASQVLVEGEVPKCIVTDSSKEDDQVSEMGV